MVTDLKNTTERLPGDFIAIEGFVVYYGIPLVVKGRVLGVLEVYHRTSLEMDSEWVEFLRVLARQAAIAIDNATMFEDLQRTNLQLGVAYDSTLEVWARTLEFRENKTPEDTQRLVDMTIHLARVMQISEDELIYVRRGVLLHDIGIVTVPDSILHKTEPLTDKDWEIIRRHPTYARELLSSVPFLQPALDIPYCHHEKWDGTGYPRGLKAEKIPLAARVFAVIDTWEALSADQPHRKAWPREKIINYIREQSGKHFDPRVVDTFLTLDGIYG